MCGQKNQKNSIQAKISGVTPKLVCPCGCDREISGRPGKIYYSRQCKDRMRNRARYEKQKLAVMLAYRLEELIPTIKRLVDEVLELHEVRKGG